MAAQKKTKESSVRLDMPSRGKKIASLLAIRDEKQKVVGRLDIRNKTVIFRGKCDEAARAFFQASKEFIEGYIRESLTPKPKPEKIAEDESRLGRALRTLHLKKSDVLSHNIRDGRMVIVTQDGKKLIV